MANIVGEEKHTVLLDDIQEEVECVVCLETPRSDPVFQCDHGHILCTSCHEKLSDCPVCKVKLGNTRCLSVEKILAKYPRPCRFDEYGCNVKKTASELDAHQEVCIYKPILCPSLNCEELFPIIETLDHMDRNHKTHRKLDQSAFYGTFPGITKIMTGNKSFKFEPVSIQLDGRVFFSECWRTCKGSWYVWLYILGTPTESKSYIFTAKIMSSDRVEELSYTGQCVSLHIGLDQIGRVGRCLSFNDDTANHFIYNDSIPVHISVTRNPTAQTY